MAHSGRSPWLNGSFPQYRTFRGAEKGRFECQLSARPLEVIHLLMTIEAKSWPLLDGERL